MGLELIHKTNAKNLIILIHGFTGGKETWIKPTGKNSLLKLLLSNPTIKQNFDVAYFEYYTKFFSSFPGLKQSLNLMFQAKKPFQANLTISQISNILKTEIENRASNYENLILIAHSMGGIISKNYILSEIGKDSRVNLFLSLAVPHNGSNFALLGNIVSRNNPQIKDLKSLSPFTIELNQKWLQNDSVPRTIYFLGYNDNIVPYTAAVGYEKIGMEVAYFDRDHFTILIPESDNDIVVTTITNKLLELLESTANPLNKKDLETRNEVMDNNNSKVSISESLDIPTMPTQLDDLKELLSLITEKITVINKAKILSTDPSVKFKLEHDLKDLMKQKLELENQINDVS